MKLINKLLPLLLLVSVNGYAVTVYLTVNNTMIDEFTIVHENITSNTKGSTLPAAFNLIKPKQQLQWTVEVPGTTLKDIQTDADFLYEIELRTSITTIHIESANIAGLSQYPTMKNALFHLYDIDSKITRTDYASDKKINVLRQYVEINISRSHSFIGY